MLEREAVSVRLSLGKKIVLLLIAFAIVLSGTGIFVSLHVFGRMNNEHFMARANEIAAVTARSISPEAASEFHNAVVDIYSSTDDHVLSDEWGSPEFEAYVSHYAKLADTPAYREILSSLRSSQEVLDVDCLYTSFVDPVNKTFVYLVDAAEEEPCPIGCIDPLYEVNYGLIDDPTIGFPAYITKTEEYGWLVTAGAPIYDAQGAVICYALVDISMDAIKAQETSFAWNLSLALGVITVVLSLVAAFLINRFVTSPLNKLSDAAKRYCDPEASERSTFEGLGIETHDEIQDLHESMIQMEHDIDGYIDNLMSTQAELKDTRQEADLMSVLAHKDALTGLRNKLAFDQEMRLIGEELLAGPVEFGLAIVDMNGLKHVNDSYGHDCGNVSLMRLSELICSVFVHSPVFRIGGDEFTIILRNNDYDKVEELVRQFMDAVAAQQEAGGLKPWERVSGAIGYALYDAKVDIGGPDDVFRRADFAMYEHKKAMKDGEIR